LIYGDLLRFGMHRTQLPPESMNDLRQRLLGGTPFLEIAHYFIECAIKDDPNPQFKEYFREAMRALLEENSAEVAALAGSPIEKIFLHSLFLSFIKNGDFLLLHPTYDDTAKEITDFLAILKRWREFVTWFRANKPADSIETFLDGEVERGAMCQDERRGYIGYIFKYTYIPMDDYYHMTLQPRFPNIKIGGKPIRPDIYFWVPNKPDIKIIVECDGFHYHSDKQKFTSDRQRDRALKALGYDVLRFSGSEIVKDPVNAPYELASYLWDRTMAHGS
jgi:hypothetical protein